jgi:predicted CopG family antitoxin
MKPLNIIICIIIIILVYGIYLNINNSKIEGFVIDTQSNKIEKLIETKEHQHFNVKIWDNEAQLSGIYTNQDVIPIDFEKCKLIQKDQTKFINSCPLSIWRASPSEGYESIGDVITKGLRSPLQETIMDVRKPKSPGAINEKTLTSIGVNGSILMEPEDYMYVGGFGKDVMIDRVKKNELFNYHMKKITFYMNLYNKYVEEVNNNIINQLKIYNTAVQNSFGSYISELKKIRQIEPKNDKTIQNINNIINTPTFAQNVNINYLSNIPISTNKLIRQNKLYVEIVDNVSNFNNPFSISKLMNGFPTAIKKIIFKEYDSSKEIINFKAQNYIYKISNIKLIPTDKLINISTKKSVNIQYENDEISDYSKHYTIGVPAGVNMSLVYNVQEVYRDKSAKGGIRGFFRSGSVKGEKKTRDKILVSDMGDPYKADETILNNHESRENGHFQTTKIISIDLSVNPNLIEDLRSQILNNENLAEKYEQLNNAINNFKIAFPQFNKNDYHRLSIWQPIPPPGFVALGFIFTNDEKDIKPSKQLIKCIPESCVKNFKRRPWIPNEDMIFKYKDASQHLSFYRNPFLGTIIVVDENKQNGLYLNKTPTAIKYRNEKESLNWECFDIVPCIKESDYIKSLETADKSSKQMCKAFRGIENTIYDNSSVKQSIIDEETKLNNTLKDKKKYLDGLMGKINSIMSEDELYKLISQGLNRYKMRKDLETQRQLHGQVADKLLRTRGLEISWDASSEMGKFKDLVKKIVVAQYSKVNETKKDCPVCKIPDTSEYVKLKDLEMCYGCLEDVVRELINKKRTNGETVPEELLELENNMK